MKKNNNAELKSDTLMVKSNNCDNINEGIFITDNDGRISFANNTLAHIFGFDNPNDLLNKYFTELIEPSERKIVSEAISKSNQSGETAQDINVSIIRTDGTKAIIQFKPSIIYEGKQKKGTQGIIIDITERKKAEENLRQSEAKYHAIFEATGTATFIVEKDTTIIMANHQCYDVTGYSPNELIGQKWTRYIAQECLNEMIKNHKLRRTNPAEAPSSYEVKLINKKGEIRNSLINVGMIAGTQQSIVSITDITERKRTEEARIISESNLQALINNKNESIWSLDNNYNLIIANEFFRNTYNATYKVELKVGINLIKILSPELKEFWKPKYDTALSGKKISFEFSETIQGKLYYFDVFLNPIISNGKVTGVSALSVDITERKEAEDRIKRAEERLRTFLENVDDMVYFQSLDGKLSMLNNVSTQISGYSNEEFSANPMLWKKIIHPDDVNIAREFFARHPQGTPYFEIEYRLMNKKGELRWIHSRMAGAKDSTGKYIGYNCIDRDITERKQMEEDLKAIEKQQSLIFNSLPVAVYSAPVDPEIDAFWISDSIFDMTGFTAKEFVSELYFWRQRLHPEDKENVIRTFSNISNLKETNIEYRWKIKTGEYRWFLDKSIINKNKEKNEYFGVIMDITDNKRIEEALKESERRYRNFFEKDISGVYLSSVEGKLLDCNSSFALMLGYDSVNEIFSKSTKEFYLKDTDRTEFLNKLQNEKVLIDSEIELVKRDGSKINVIENVVGIFNNNGKLIQFQGYMLDITERKKAEESLKESEEFRLQIMNSLDEGLLVCNNADIIVDVNPCMVKISGYSREELIGQNAHMLLMPPEYQPLMGKRIRERREGKSEHYEFPMLKKDGSKIWVRIAASPIRDVNGVVIGSVGANLDINEQKLAEEALRISEEKYRNLLDNMGEGIAIMDENENFIFVNPSAEKIFGVGKGELTNVCLKTFLSSENFEKAKRQTKERIQGKSDVFEEEIILKDGSKKIILVFATPWFDNDKFKGTYGIFSDITERKQYESKLVEAKERAERSDKLKDAFIANISHEIRTPLNGILGMTELIKNSLSKYIHSEENSYFAAIEQANARIVRTIDMILNFSRLQVGDFTVSPKQINISSIIRNLLNEYKTKANKKSIKLTFENKCGEVFLEADEYCIAQAISNLIDNAIKYTVKGEVKLVMFTDTENILKLVVEDTGIGISDDYIDHIFEPYSQEEIGYNRGYEGVGLGMSLVKKYLDLNETEITVKSVKDKGTTFTVHFKNSKIIKSGQEFTEVISQEPPKFIPTDQSKSVNKPRILIVEDDEINHFYIRSLLIKNYETASAYSADSALEILKSQIINLILMDISLKGDMNGLELTKLLKDSKAFKNIPIIAVTGHASPEDKQNCLNAGCYEYLSKPFSDTDLIEKIKQFSEKVS